MLKTIANRVERFLEIAAGGLCLILISVLSIEVINRYFLGISWPWVQYIIPFCFLWMIMFGTAIAVRRNQHFEVDFVANLLTGVPKRIHYMVMLFSVFGGGALITWASVGFVQLGMLKSSPATGTPMIYIYASLLVGGALIMLFALERLVAKEPDKLESRFDEVSL